MEPCSISWEQLKDGIKKAFSSDTLTDIEHLKRLMGSYKSRRDDWAEHEYFKENM